MDDMGNVLTESSISGLFESVTEIHPETAYKIDVSFDRRLRVWQEQILPDRENEIHQENTVEFVYRMLDLLFEDADRLTNRAITEGVTDEVTMLSRIRIVNKIVEDTLGVYMAASDKIKLSRGK